MELQGLVKDGIMTEKEAREILFTEKEENEPKADELKSEIEFLRKLVENLSIGKYNKTVEYIHTYPDRNWNWYQPYYAWCGTNSTLYTGNMGSSTGGLVTAGNYNLSGTNSTQTEIGVTTTANSSFDSIKTF